jgi:hypothetical protein
MPRNSNRIAAPAGRSHAFRDLKEQPAADRDADGPVDQGIDDLVHPTSLNASARQRNARRVVLLRLLILDKSRSGLERCAQPHGYSLTDLTQHRLDVIGGEKPRARLAVGDQRNHHRAARTRHDRMIAGRKRSRHRRDCDIQRPHELNCSAVRSVTLGIDWMADTGTHSGAPEFNHLSKRLTSSPPAKTGVNETRQPVAIAAAIKLLMMSSLLLENSMHPRLPDRQAVRCGLPDATGALLLGLLRVTNIAIWTRTVYCAVEGARSDFTWRR